MSHFVKMTVQAQQKHEAELVEALVEHFGADAVTVHEEAVRLKTWDGGLSTNKGNIVVPREAQLKKANRHVLTADVGYERNANGTYDVHYDADGFPIDQQKLIAQYYAEKVAAKQLKRQGYAVKRAMLDDGRIQLTATKF